MTSSSVYLVDKHANNAVEAELIDGVTEKHLRDVETHWYPVLFDAIKRLIDAGKTLQDLPQDWHWNWRGKIERIRHLLAYRTFAVVCEGHSQGLMQVKTTGFCRLPEQHSKPLVYVEYLETAPWNRGSLVAKPRFGGVGSVLLAAAIQLSREEGFHGRIGLHSLPQSDTFYSQRCGMADLGQDATVQNLRYFELTPEQADAFRE